MLEGVFNAAVLGAFALLGLWWAVMASLRNSVRANQTTRDNASLGMLVGWTNGTFTVDALRNKCSAEGVAIRSLPDELGRLAVERERPLIPLASVGAVLLACLLVEVGIGLGGFDRQAVRQVSLLLCCVGVLLELSTALLIALVARNYEWREALRSLAIP